MDASVAQVLGHIVLLINIGIVVYSMVRQIRLNDQLKMATGLSLSSLLIKLSSRLANLYFSIALQFAFLYPAMHVLYLGFQLVMTRQYFLYSKEKYTSLHTRALVIFALSLVAWMWLYTAKDFYGILGNVVGWLLVISQIAMDGPQIFHNWRRKSVVGFSYDYVWLNFIAILLGGICNYLFQLPLQAHLQSWFSFFVKLVLLLQHRYYQRKGFGDASS